MIHPKSEWLLRAIWRCYLSLMVACCFVLPFSGARAEQLRSARKPSQTGFWLTVNLNDGSRIIGRSAVDRFQFRSEALGEFELSLQELRNIDSQPKTNLFRLTRTSGSPLRAEFATADIRMATSFGGVTLPVGIIRSIRVSGTGTTGRPMDGLIALWSGDGNAVDSIGGNNGVEQNVSYTNGVAGQAFALAPDNFSWGTYCGVQIADKPAYELTNSLTIECWIRPRNPPGFLIFFRGDHRPGLDPYSLSLDDSQNLVFGISDSDGNQASVRTPMEFGQWTHVAGVLDGSAGTMSLYTNGVLAAQITTTVHPGNVLQDQSPGVGIGNVNDGGNNFPFVGEIDEVGLYDRALFQYEVNAIFVEHQSAAAAQAKPLAKHSDQSMGALPRR